MNSISDLNQLSNAEFLETLGGIYEHSDWIPQRILDQRPFTDREGVGTAMKEVVDASSPEEKMMLILAHPDLAGKLARAGSLTEFSTSEQTGLGLDQLSDAEYDLFANNNSHYRSRFGFPFIICARKTTKAGVLEAFDKRLLNSPEVEIKEAIVQIHHIASLRLTNLLSA